MNAWIVITPPAKMEDILANGSEHNRTKTTSVRFSPDELEKLKSRAEKAGLTVGALVRQMVLDAPPPKQSRRPSVDAELLSVALSRMGKIGSNVNQLARSANRGRAPDIPSLTAACDAVLDIRTIIYLALGHDVDIGNHREDDKP